MAKEKDEALTPQQEKMKALQAAMSKIEKDYGKGSIMRMGDEQIENVEVLSLLVRLHWPSMPSQNVRRLVASLPSLMQSMRSTASMQRN